MNTQRAAIDELVDTLTPALGGRHLADDVYSLHVVCAARSYPYLDSMAPATRRMLEAIKETADPACLLNPGAWPGLAPPTTRRGAVQDSPDDLRLTVTGE